ncbi:3'-5' exonuclease [Rheinheimera sp. 1928-s]|uniref:3'-5' exonuclease n=1 Tax=Rheinheimera sp. 1928-s TaxID=3033803 RepID=UPI002636192A|nr:3'-5' exonuclease [Rheinheimera sp. 1928-s]MDF3125500.1 3'-5' exonuclease [Rheinheimera sp. 1928-s]
MFYLKKQELKTDPLQMLSKNWQNTMQQLELKAKDPRLKVFYQAGAAAAETALQEISFVALDFETTGLDPVRDGIVSIGLVPLTLERIHSSKAQSYLVKPRVQLNESSVIVHGITDSAIAQAADLELYIEPLLQALAGKVVLVHHLPIERAFLYHGLMSRLGEGIVFPMIDTLALERGFTQSGLQGWWRSIRGQSKPSLRLADCRQRYQLPAYQPHHAVTDAIACAELFQAQVAQHFSASTPVGKLWS